MIRPAKRKRESVGLGVGGGDGVAHFIRTDVEESRVKVSVIFFEKVCALYVSCSVVSAFGMVVAFQLESFRGYVFGYNLWVFEKIP